MEVTNMKKKIHRLLGLVLALSMVCAMAAAQGQHRLGPSGNRGASSQNSAVRSRDIYRSGSSVESNRGGSPAFQTPARDMGYKSFNHFGNTGPRQAASSPAASRAQNPSFDNRSSNSRSSIENSMDAERRRHGSSHYGGSHYGGGSHRGGSHHGRDHWYGSLGLNFSYYGSGYSVNLGGRYGYPYGGRYHSYYRPSYVSYTYSAPVVRSYRVWVPGYWTTNYDSVPVYDYYGNVISWNSVPRNVWINGYWDVRY